MLSNNSSNAKRAYINVTATADDAKRARTIVAASSNGSNTKRVRTNKAIIIDEGGTKGVYVNVAATAYAILTAKRIANANVVVTASKPTKKRVDGNTRRADINVTIIANKIAITCVNVMATNAKAGANVAVTTNANKATINTKERVPAYRRPQMPT